MTWASTWEMMNRTLEAFATRNTDSSDRRDGKSRKTFKKPKEFKDDSDGCIDTWVEVMRLHLEQDNLNDERQACTAILSNLEGTALKCVVAKKEEERDTADKTFEILLNRFGSGMKGHQAMMRFEKRRQRDDESIDRFLDDLESLRRRSDPEESTNRRNFSIASKFIDGVKSDDSRTMLATYYTLSKDSAPTPEEMRQKSREYMPMKPKKYSYSENRNTQGGGQPQRSSWYKPRDDMDKRRSCANCGSADHHVADCTTYKQGMKSLGYAPDEEDMSQMEEHEYYNGLIIKIGARCFFCNQEGHFRMDCPLFWEAVKDQSHPKHKLALAAVQNPRNRQNEFESRNLGAPSTELPTKTVKAVTHVNGAIESAAGNSLEINYEKAATEAITRVKQDLAAKEIEQRLKLEIERQNFNEALTGSNQTPEAVPGSTKTENCNTVKMVTGKPFSISKIGARIMSIITVGGHEVTRNLSEPSDQTIMHIDVYADYLSCISPQTTSRALRALLSRGGSKSVRVDNRYTEDYGPHEVMLNIDGINIYTKTMITCDEDLIGQIYVGKEQLKVKSIGHCAMLEEDAMHIGTEADVTGHVLDISGKKTQLRGLLDTGAVLSVIPIETWERMGFDKGDLIDSRIRLSAANKGALRVLGRTPIIALNLGERNLWMSFIVKENLDESDQFILGRDFIRNFEVTIDLNNAMFRIRNPDRRYAIKPVNLIMANENKAPVFLSRRVRLKANEAVIVSLRMKNYNELSDNKQVCIVPNPNSQSAAVLGRSFSITKSGLCVSVLLNTLDIPITIQRGRKLGYALPVKTRYETIENSKQIEVVDCPNHRDKICIFRRLQKIKDSSGLEMKYGAPKAEMFAVVTFVEKYRAYLGSEPFKLRVDNRALSWLKTYSMDQSYIGRWIVRLDGYNMIIEHRTRDKHQNADSLSKKTEFYERQEQREAGRPEIKDGFSFMDKETYDSLPLTRWLDKSGKPIEDHPELPKEPPEKTILKKSKRIPIEIILKSKIVRETLKATGYDLNQVGAGTAQIDDDLMRLLEKLSDEKPVIQEKGQEEPEVTILRREETVNNTDSSRGSVTDSKDVVRSLVDKIPENILEQTKVRKKKVTFKEDTEHLGLGQESGECSMFTEEETGEGRLG